MNSNYLEALELVKRTMTKLEKLCDGTENKEIDNQQACITIDSLIQELERAADTLEYYSKSVKAGQLIKSSSGKYEIAYNDGGTSYPLSCGSSLEVYDEEEGWVAGRVEHTGGKGYYFYNSDIGDPALYDGMKVRHRV